jgi:threonyl-tRNA synthetase
MNISEAQAEHVAGVAETLRKAGFRAVADLRNEKISYKIREHSLQKLPFQLVIGDKEVAAQLVAVRSRKGEDLGQMPLDAFLSLLNGEISKKGRAV